MFKSNKIFKFPIISKRILYQRKHFSSHKNVTGINYQYMQRSKVPTMHFQKSLPRLPVPELPKTGERYLNAIRPLLSKDQYAEAEVRTMDFVEKSGKTLQEKLIAKDKLNKHTSYISDYWFDVYLRDRTALPINFNPLIVFQNDTRPAYNDQLIKASNMLISATRFMCSLRKHILEPEIYHMNPKKSNTQLFRNVTGILPESLSWFVFKVLNK
jgi:carnitine O-palmitoyltransferase 2